MNKYYLFCVLFIFSCTENNPRGKFLKEEVKDSKSKLVIDSIWENYKITEIRLPEYGLSHKYHFIDSLEPFEYSVEHRGEILMKYDSIHKEESYKTGSSIHILSNEEVMDSLNIELLIACPYVMRNCLHVNIFQGDENGSIDTLIADYTPKGDIITLRIDKRINEINVETFLCEKELDKLNLPLQ
jgi:hypothetical protein